MTDGCSVTENEYFFPTLILFWQYSFQWIPVVCLPSFLFVFSFFPVFGFWGNTAFTCCCMFTLLHVPLFLSHAAFSSRWRSVTEVENVEFWAWLTEKLILWQTAYEYLQSQQSLIVYTNETEEDERCTRKEADTRHILQRYRHIIPL